MKRKFSTEAAYVLGILILAFGTALMEKANFGMSMVVAPAYLLHRKVSQFLPFFSFGMAEYTFQAFLIVLLVAVMRRFKPSYLLSFATAVFYGFVLDGCMAVVAPLVAAGFAMRAVLYVAGLLLGSLGVAMLFNTYISPEAYELFVMEVSRKSGIEISRFKTGYDIVSCLVGVAMSFAFFGLGHFEGVKLGTILCALVNGPVIGFISRGLHGMFEFSDALPLRRFFE